MSESVITLEGFLEGVRKMKHPPPAYGYALTWHPDTYRAILKIDAKWQKIWRDARIVRRNRARGRISD